MAGLTTYGIRILLVSAMSQKDMQARYGMAKYGAAPSHSQAGMADGSVDTYRPNSGFGAANDQTKTEESHEAIREIGVGGNTLALIGLAFVAKNEKSRGEYG